MSNYKLTYFNARGRAELSRIIFAEAGVQYEDVRLERDQWPALKPSTPFGQLPILEVDGVRISQSHTIERYLARKFNLAGKSDLDQARADMIIDCFDDTIKPMFSFFFEKDEAKKAELVKKFKEEELPKSLAALEEILKANKGGDGYFVGDDLTWADLGFFSISEWMSIAGADTVIANYPKLTALRQRVEKRPKLVEWLAKRPKTGF